MLVAGAAGGRLRLPAQAEGVRQRVGVGGGDRKEKEEEGGGEPHASSACCVGGGGAGERLVW